MRTPPGSSARFTAAAVLTAVVALGRSPSPSSPERPLPTSASAEDEPVRVRTELITHWVKTLITKGAGVGPDGERKEMPIGQHALHEDVVAATRAGQKHQGPATEPCLTERQPRQRCTAERGAERGGPHRHGPIQNYSP